MFNTIFVHQMCWRKSLALLCFVLFHFVLLFFDFDNIVLQYDDGLCFGKNDGLCRVEVHVISK